MTLQAILSAGPFVVKGAVLSQIWLDSFETAPGKFLHVREGDGVFSVFGPIAPGVAREAVVDGFVAGGAIINRIDGAIIIDDVDGRVVPCSIGAFGNGGCRVSVVGFCLAGQEAAGTQGDADAEGAGQEYFLQGFHDDHLSFLCMDGTIFFMEGFVMGDENPFKKGKWNIFDDVRIINTKSYKNHAACRKSKQSIESYKQRSGIALIPEKEFCCALAHGRKGR